MVFRDVTTGYIEEASCPWLWVLLFGPLYFALKGIWSHVFISIVVAVLTSGFSTLVYPFFANSIIEKHYASNGWIRTE
jgi:peptidoglycan biosynthesis protein MviN/MurJ (putative lipid II flippase)